MSIKTIVKMGNRQLATPSKEIEQVIPISSELKQLFEDMWDTMQAEGGIGIAAPQIGCNQRVIMFGLEHSSRYPKADYVPFTILINPMIQFLNHDIIDDWEGCLSVPGFRGLVPRFNQIQYSGYDHAGHFITREAEGFHARVVQHEYDHLDGILYPQRIKNLSNFGFEDELSDRLI